MKRLLLLIMLSSCVDERIVTVEEEIELFYSSTTICNCYRSGMSVLGNLITYEKDVYKTLFQELRMNCLTKYGSQLFIPTICNYPDSIGILVDSLYGMGIDIND